MEMQQSRKGMWTFYGLFVLMVIWQLLTWQVPTTAGSFALGMPITAVKLEDSSGHVRFFVVTLDSVLESFYSRQGMQVWDRSSSTVQHIGSTKLIALDPVYKKEYLPPILIEIQTQPILAGLLGQVVEVRAGPCDMRCPTYDLN